MTKQIMQIVKIMQIMQIIQIIQIIQIKRYLRCVFIICLSVSLSACFPRPASPSDADGLFLWSQTERSDIADPTTSIVITSTSSLSDPTLSEQASGNREIKTETNTETNTAVNVESNAISQQVEELLNLMTVEEKIGQLLLCRLPNGATTVTDATKKMLDELHVGGFILFSENVQSVEQVQTLTAGLRAYAKTPLFIATDEEGGRVSRIGQLYDEKIPTAYTLAKQGDTDAVYKAAHMIGERLTALGLDMDFAPVADIWSNEVNTVIGDRAYGKDPQTVAQMTEAAVRGLKDAGILSVVKHFPGHGDTAEDSHAQLAIYQHDRERFDTFEAIPFAKGIAAGAEGVMVGHIATPLIQKDTAVLDWMTPLLEAGRLPAVFSDYWLQDILRDEMAFNGLIITDALEMKAVTAHFSDAQIALGAFLAGADVLLIPQNPAEAASALLEAYNTGVFDEARLNASVRRIMQAKMAQTET